MEKPRGCWAYLPVSDHNRWPLCSTLVPIFPKNNKSVVNWSCQRLTQTCMWHPYERGHFSFCETPRTPPLEGTSLHRRNSTVERPWGILGPVYHPSPIMSEFTLPEAVGDTYKQTCLWRLCEAGSFSYGESQRTPPLEGTSLHRWNNSVERPWGILSPFTTHFRLRVNSHFQRL